MQRRILNINDIPYLVEYTKYDEITSVFHRTQQFVMLRNYKIQNDIALDTDILLVSLDKFKSLVTKTDSGYELSDELVFPYRNENYESFTVNVFNFVPDSSTNFLYYREDDESHYSDLRTDYYNLYEKTSDGSYKISYLNCDRIRIYRPHSRKHINSIISISNIVNNIHFTYFCDKYENQELNVCKEIKVNNNFYYEYIEIYVPNMQTLFSKDIYFNEDLNYYQKINYKTDEFDFFNISNKKILLRNLILPYSITKACLKDNDCSTCPINSKYIYIQEDYIENLKVSIEELQNKDRTSSEDYELYELEEELKENEKYLNFNKCPLIDIKNNYVKSFITDNIESIEYTNTEYNFLNIPFILTLSHYDTLDEVSNKYLSLSGISPVSVSFSYENQFILGTKIDFDEHNKSIISVISTWKYPNIKDYDEEVSETEKLRDAYFYFNKITNTNEYLNFTGYDDDTFLEDFSEELTESLSFNVAGCLIEMSLDIKFKNVFYRKSVGMNSGIDDFAFNLDGIFDNWKEYPEVIFVRTFFIDKYLSKVFGSNICVLTKEKFKYCINNTNGFYKLTLPNTETSWYNRDLDDDMKTFFIDKINCSINKYDVLNENIITSGSSSPTSIIYKTVFYKTHDTQHIRIRQNVIQNIGINLNEYLTKVENFKLVLEGYEFTESARNDVYVIFKIPGTYITNQYGNYDIMDADDDTYITSGEYELV